MGASGRWFKSLLSHKKTSTTDQEKGGDSNRSNKKKWKLWRTSSEGSMKSKSGESEKSCESSLYNVAVAAVVRAPPKDFMVIKQEWAAIRIQAVFRAFLARRALRALKAVVRIQALFRGRLVRKQAAVTLRCMQALVRVQARVRANNVRKSPEGKAVQKLLDEHRNQTDPLKLAEQRWCDIPGTVDEVKTKLRLRQEGAIKRDRAMAYSLSTQQSRMCGSPNSRTSKAMTPFKPHNLDSKSIGCSLLERWMATKPWESPISRKSEDLVPIFQSRINGVTKRISVNKPLTQSTPSSSAISSECMYDDSPVSTSCTSGSPPSLPSTNMLEATEERDVHKLSYMNLTESTKAKMKACRSSSQNSKRQVMEDCMSHSSKTTFLNGDGRSSSGSDPSVNLWKDLSATPLRASYHKRYGGR